LGARQKSGNDSNGQTSGDGKRYSTVRSTRSQHGGEADGMNGLAEFKRPVAVSKRQENAKGWLIMGSAQAGMAWHGMAFVLDCSSAYFSATGSLLHSEPTHYWAKKPSPPLQARPRPPVYVLALCLRSRSSCDDCTCRRRVKFDATLGPFSLAVSLCFNS
jgi:hypothetical protein